MTDEPQHKRCQHRKIFVAARWDQSQEEWTIQQVFTSKKAAIACAYDETQTAVRCARPMEWWRVVEHTIPVDGDIIWGCERVTVGDSEQWISK